MSEPIAVTLTGQEIHQAALVGVWRGLGGFRQGKAPANSFEKGRLAVMDSHFYGAIGECAFAKHYNLFWSFSVGTYRLGGDVGEYQIRTGTDHEKPLIIRPRDNPEKSYISVTCQWPQWQEGRWKTLPALPPGQHYEPEIFIRGWMSCAFAFEHGKELGWWDNPGNRGYAYFIPQNNLLPMEDLFK